MGDGEREGGSNGRWREGRWEAERKPTERESEGMHRRRREEEEKQGKDEGRVECLYNLAKFLPEEARNRQENKRRDNAIVEHKTWMNGGLSEKI
jgi:hypothetical protein